MSDSDGATEQGLGAVLAQLLHDAETLLLQEVALARAEAGESLRALGGGLLLALLGVGLGVTGGIALGAAMIVLLSAAMPLALAAALVGVVFVLAGGGLLWWSRGLVAHATFVPRRALAAASATAAWAREELT